MTLWLLSLNKHGTMFIKSLDTHFNPFASNQSCLRFLLQFVWYFLTRPGNCKTISLKSKHESDILFLKEKQTLMPPFEEWGKWFEHLWETAFESGEDGQRRYYYFFNFILSYVCYPFGSDAAKRAARAEVETTAAAVVDADTHQVDYGTLSGFGGTLSGKYLNYHCLMKSILELGQFTNYLFYTSEDSDSEEEQDQGVSGDAKAHGAHIDNLDGQDATSTGKRQQPPFESGNIIILQN